MEQITIKQIEEFDSLVLNRVNELLNQLVSKPVVFTEQAFHSLLASDASKLFLVYVDCNIAGMLTLGTYASPTGVKYWIEDVVVDQAYRGRSLGRKLINFTVDYVKGLGKGTLMLTSKPARIAANALYRSSGFQSKETNVYKMDIEG